MHNKSLTMIFTAIIIAAMLLPGVSAASVQAAPAAPVAVDVPTAAGETCQVLQPGPATALDSYIKQEKQDERQGTSNELKVKTENGKLIRSLLQFDLSFLPAGASVSSATLSLWVKEVRDGGATISAHQVTSSWRETEVTWKARDKAAALLWSALGGDYNASPLDSEPFVKDIKNYWATWNVTAAAANWAATPANNFGVILESPVTTPKNETKFKSSDDGTTTQRPKLEVCYTTGPTGGVTITPDNSGQGVSGQTKTYAHTVTVGSVATAVNLSAASSKSWTTRIYRDTNSNGQLDGGEPQISQLPSTANASAAILVQIDIPASAAPSTVDYTTVTATAAVNNTSDTARDTTRVGALISVTPNGGTFATAGSQVFYGHTVTNNGASTDQISVSATSSLGWQVLLWEEDRTGSGVYTTPLVNPLSLDPGESYPIVVEVRVPAGATAGMVDRTVVRAASTNEPGVSGVAVDTTEVFVNAPPVIDGKYDQIYQTSPDANEVCYVMNGQILGRLASFSQPAGDSVYMVLALDKGFVDNTYGANAAADWPSGHDFGELVGSDKAQFYGYDANDVKVLDFQLDYITAKTGEPSGYASLGFNGGDGKINSAPTGITYTSFPEWGTSIDYSLNDTDYCSGGATGTCQNTLLVNSPATNELYTPNATYPKWIFDVIYEFRVLKSAFGANGYGSLAIPYVHASPSKAGTNDLYPEPVPCDNQIGDFVWHDLNHDSVQDPNEPGIDGVQLKLYSDSNGDGIWDPNVDQVVGTRTTSSGGRYLFQTIPAGDYFVKVVDSTVPGGYVLTTDNDPTPLISLAEGQSFLQADFGYTVAYGELEINKTLTSTPPFYVGQEIDFKIEITNAGSTIVTVLPLEDYYDPTTLEFVSATPTPVSAANDGVLNWSDLTVVAPAGFGRDLGPGETFTINVRFRALQATSMMAAGMAAIAGLDADPIVDGRLDNNYSFVKRFLYPANDAPGNLYGFTGANMCYYALVVDRSFNDNVYADPDDATYRLQAGWDRTHKYGDLDGSDKAVFNITYPGGSLTNLTLDYVEYNSGVAGSGQTGAEGSEQPGTPPIQDAMTSMHWNFLNSGWNGGTWGLITKHSPPFDYNQTSGKYWEWAMIYEFSIAKSLLGGTCGEVTLASAHNSPTKFDAGLATIGDRVWADANENKLQDTGEIGLPGVVVNLYQGSTSTLVRTTQTEPGTSGLYSFVNLPAGSYRVEVNGNTVPTDWVLTTGNLPFNVSVSAGQDVTDADFGYWESGTASIGDRVWYDLNGDGAQDAGEPGINSVTMNLYNGACVGGLLKKTMTTSGDGAYDFTKLPAGTYCVEVDNSSLPDGYTLTTGNEPLTWTLADGDQYKDADFGYQASCPDGTPNAATTRNAVDSTGTTLPDVVDYACAEIGGNPGAIGDFVWHDADRDGIQDVGEPGIANVTLDLYRNGVKFASTVTDADGGYLFTGLPPGAYSVRVTDLNVKLAGFTPKVGGQAQASPTPSITLMGGEVYKDADFGYYRDPAQATIGDTVWYDDNGDGIQQPGEPGIPGVTVVVSQNGAPMVSVVTDSNGHYLVGVTPGSGYTVTPVAGSVPGGLFATTPVPAVVPPLAAGEAYLAADFGYDDRGQNLLGEVGNLVWLDANQNGSLDSGEKPLGGVSVDLIRDSDGDSAWDTGEPIIATVTTESALNGTYGSNGNYLFTGTPQGRYLVHVSDTNAVLLDFTKSPVVGGADHVNRSDPYAVYLTTAGANAYTADFGYTHNPGDEVGVIGNQVWIESVRNGIFDPLQGDFGQPGVTVELLLDGQGIASTTTGASGDYSFVHLAAGDYAVRVLDDWDVLLGYSVTVLGPQQGQDNNNQNQPYGVSLASGGYNVTADFGYWQPRVLGAVGDLVWYDADRDGVQDVGEPGLPNVRVDLYLSLDGNGQLNIGVDRLVASTVTDADGGYLFPTVLPGAYFVDIVDAANPNGMLGPYKHSLGVQSSSDPTALILVAGGSVYKEADFGYYKEPVGGKAIIGDTVWYDDNGDRLQQPGEPGIPGVTVVIKDASGSPIGSAVTDGTGRYLIEVPVGKGYTAEVDGVASGTVLDNLAPTTPQPHGLPPLSVGQQYLDADFGYDDEGLNLLSDVGNLVWLDPNQNGVFDGGETPLAGVSVDLIRDSDGDSAWDAGEPIIATVTTESALNGTYGSNGNYLFTGVPQGRYLVHVSDTNAVLLDFTKSVVVSGADNVNRSDPYAVDLATAGANAYTADFGYSHNPGDEVGVIGNQVWIEPGVVVLINGEPTRVFDGIFNPLQGDFGQHGVTVELLAASGQVLATTTTGASGDYSFVHLAAGDYRVRVSPLATSSTSPVAVLKGYGPTTDGPQQGQDNNNQIQPYGVSLASGGYNVTADFGYNKQGEQSTGMYRITKTLNTPDPVRINREISFTIAIQNTSDTAYITYLQLQDVYDTKYLTYLRAVPATVDNINDGEVNWRDLTETFGAIPPRGTVNVVVWFKGIKDTSGLKPTMKTLNVATAYNVWADPDGPNGPDASSLALPDKTDDALVGITVPTGVSLAGFSATPAPDGIAVGWETVEELNIAGFNVLRQAGDGELTILNSELLFAQNAGANMGAAYGFMDTAAPEGVVTYVLHAVRLDGSVETLGEVEVAR